MVETGEGAGSPGLLPFLRQHRDFCAADVFIALDGPRQSMSVPDITLGTRGGIAIDLVVELREGSHHSGHWGGLLADPGVILAHAIANIVSQDGRILAPGWTPAVIPSSVRQASHDVVIEDLPGTPVPDQGWGEPGLSRSERIYIAHLYAEQRHRAREHLRPTRRAGKCRCRECPRPRADSAHRGREGRNHRACIARASGRAQPQRRADRAGDPTRRLPCLAHRP